MARRSEEWAAGLIRGFRFPARFEVERVIGRGGSGAVLAAFDRRLGRRVAIKALDAASELTRLEDAVDEAEVLAALSHPNLVTVHDTFTGRSDAGGEVVFLVMEHVDGPDLAQFLRNGRLTPSQVMQVAEQLVAALQYVHDRGFLHRDIKPSNVLLQFTGEDVHARLSDFGTAVAAVGPVEQGEFTVGTAAYLSPEQAEGTALAASSDVYSLGLVLLEAATGRVAFPGSIIEAALARLDTDPVVPPELPDPLRRVLVGMTRRDPVRRLTLKEVRRALREPVVAVPVAPAPDRPAPPVRADPTSTASFFRPQELELVRLLELVTQVLDAAGAAVLEVQDGRQRHRAEHRLPELATVQLRSDLQGDITTGGDVEAHVVGDARYLTCRCGVDEGGSARHLVVALGQRGLRGDGVSIMSGFAEVIESALNLRQSLRRALFAR